MTYSTDDLKKLLETADVIGADTIFRPVIEAAISEIERLQTIESNSQTAFSAIDTKNLGLLEFAPSGQEMRIVRPDERGKLWRDAFIAFVKKGMDSDLASHDAAITVQRYEAWLKSRTDPIKHTPGDAMVTVHYHLDGEDRTMTVPASSVSKTDPEKA